MLTEVCLAKAMVFPVVIYGCESWTVKKAEHWRIDAFELWCSRRLLSPLDCKEIQPVHPKGNQSWIFIGRTDAEAETPTLWPHDVKNGLLWKDPDTGEDWRQEEKGMTEDEMVGWHHWLYGHEFEQAPGIGDGQGSLVCCSPWCLKVRHDWATELNSTDVNPDMSSFTALYHASWYCVFYKLKIWNNPLSRKSTGAIFPTAFAHFMSLCHILITVTIFKIFSFYYIYKSDQWFWCYYCNWGWWWLP